MSDHGRGDPDLRYGFASDAQAPRGARRAVEPWLEEPGDPIAEDVSLATSEMVTNVITHTTGGGELRLWDPKPDVPLRLEVEDCDPQLPTPVQPGDRAVGGRGLRILEHLSDRWGFVRTVLGKFVWAEFDRSKGRPRR